MHKIILLLFILLSINTAVADSIRCIHNGKFIYSRTVRDVILIGNSLFFIEEPSDKITFYTGDCSIKILLKIDI